MWPVGPRYAPAITKVPASVCALQLVKGAPGCAAWVVNALGCGANQEHLLVLAVQTLSSEARQGKAIIAVAHTLMLIGYHLHKNQSNHEDLGGNCFDRSTLTV